MSADLEACWYECDLIDSTDVREPPDFSRVPEDRREDVRSRWLEANRPEAERWRLWGPQVELYRRTGFEVAVIRELSEEERL